MAKLELTLNGNFSEILRHIEKGVLNGSFSATLEESGDFYENGARCSVRVFERYSFMGQNRLSLSVTLFQGDGPIRLFAVTSGGSQAMFFKIIPWGEGSFMEAFYKCIKEFIGE